MTLNANDLLRPASSRQRRVPIEPVSVSVPSPTKSPLPTGYFSKKPAHAAHLAQLQPLEHPAGGGGGAGNNTSTSSHHSNNSSRRGPPGNALGHTPPKKSSAEAPHSNRHASLEAKEKTTRVEPLPIPPPVVSNTAALPSSSPGAGEGAPRPMSKRRVVPPVAPVQATPRPQQDDSVVVVDGEALLKSKPPPVNPNTLILSPVHPQPPSPRGSGSPPAS